MPFLINTSFSNCLETNFTKDSFYKNKKIKNLKRDERKTYIDNWFELKLEKKIIT